MGAAGGDALRAAWDALRSARFEDAEHAFTSRLEDDALGAEAYEGLSWVAWYRDDGPTAITMREHAYTRYRERDRTADAARVALWLAICHLEFAGNEALAEGWFGRAADLLASAPRCAEHGWMSLHHAAIAVEGGGDAAAARRAGEEVASLARELGDGDLEIVARSVEGLGLVLEGDVAAGMKKLGSSATAALAGEVLEPVHAGWACCYAIYGCEAVGEYGRAADWCEQASRLGERMRMPYLFRVCRCHYAAALIGFGDWTGAERELLDGIDALRPYRPGQAVEGIVRLADLRRRQGRYDEAMQLYADAEGHPLALLGVAAIKLDRGELDPAMADLERALRRLPAENKAGRFALLEMLVEGSLATGDVDRAEAIAREIDALSQRYGTRHFAAIAKRRHGDIAFAQGDNATARHALEDALDLFRAVNSTYEATSARIALARVLAQIGETTSARDEAERAAAEAERLGARGLWARAQVLLREGNAHNDVLTAREREILGLIGDGLTDKAIAARLHLSTHTVHRHVANIRTKLGVPSRAAAVAYARRSAGR